jgi:hypothetical protein
MTLNITAKDRNIRIDHHRARDPIRPGAGLGVDAGAGGGNSVSAGVGEGAGAGISVEEGVDVIAGSGAEVGVGLGLDVTLPIKANKVKCEIGAVTVLACASIMLGKACHSDPLQ